jgi:protocatechuate 3,4-dioxygenase, beta subunit
MTIKHPGELSMNPPRILPLTRALLLILLPSIMLIGSCASREEDPRQEEPQPVITVSDGCEDCDLIYNGMPGDVSSETVIASPSEPGERLEIGGIIHESDGTTPAPGVILYLYHTDAKGDYSQSLDSSGRTRHGHLRGWIKTNARGEYRFSTIRPAAYPNGIDPAHIHAIIKEPGRSEYYIDDYVFEDDSLLTPEHRSRYSNRGGSGIVQLTKGSDGVWRGRREIVLGLNVPRYQ